MEFRLHSLESAPGHGRTAALRILYQSPYADNNDRLRHFFYIKSLADEMHEPIEEVGLLYRNVLGHLKANAKVPDFLPIFTAKKVKAYFRRPFPDRPSGNRGSTYKKEIQAFLSRWPGR